MTMSDAISTADLFDFAPDQVGVCDFSFRQFGARKSFAGPCVTVRATDHRAVENILSEPGLGGVLLIDQLPGKISVAMLGDRLAGLALRTEWAAIVVNGAVRDAAQLETLPLAISARSTTARRAQAPSCEWDRGISLDLGGTCFHPGSWVVGDEDSIATCPMAVFQAWRA